MGYDYEDDVYWTGRQEKTLRKLSDGWKFVGDSITSLEKWKHRLLRADKQQGQSSSGADGADFAPFDEGSEWSLEILDKGIAKMELHKDLYRHYLQATSDLDDALEALVDAEIRLGVRPDPRANKVTISEIAERLSKVTGGD